MGCHRGSEVVPPHQQLLQMCDLGTAAQPELVACWQSGGVPFMHGPHRLPCLPQPDPPACWEPTRTTSGGRVTLSYSLPFPRTPARARLIPGNHKPNHVWTDRPN